MGDDTVHVWHAFVDVPAPRVQALETTLTPDELFRADRFRFKRDRDRFVAARGALRAILACYLGASAKALRFRYGPYGKPELAGRFGETLTFNVAHSEGLALFALAAGRGVGVDVEVVGTHSVDDQVAAQYFSAHDNARLHALPPAEREEAFLRLWTRREAYLKARGAGLATAQAGWDAHPAPQWLIRDLTPARGYIGALAVEGQVCRLMSRRWLWLDPHAHRCGR